MVKRGLIALIYLCGFSITLFGENIFFNGDIINVSQKSGKQLITLEGRASLESDEFKITADKIELLGSNFDEVRADGHVFLLSKVNQSEIKSKKINYYRLTKRMVATDNVSYSDGKSLEIRCNYLDQEREGFYVMRGFVRLLKDSLFARADSALYQTSTHQLQLLGQAQVYKKDSQFSADRISVNTDSEEIQMSGAVAGQLSGDDGDE